MLRVDLLLLDMYILKCKDLCRVLLDLRIWNLNQSSCRISPCFCFKVWKWLGGAWKRGMVFYELCKVLGSVERC